VARTLRSTAAESKGATPSKAGAAKHPHLFLVLQSERPLAPCSRHSLGGLEKVSVVRGSDRGVARTGGKGGDLRLEVADSWMSSAHFVLERVLGHWVLEDKGSRNGTIVNGSTVARVVLKDGDLIRAGGTFFLYRQSVASFEGDALDQDSTGLARKAPRRGTLIPALARQFDALTQVAPSTVPVLAQGETGTGKEVVARALHELSGRPGPFVAVNCSALPEGLVESELFGHRKGAFSGAAEDRPGLIRSADRGTLFLDEIGDLPLASQAKLLRALEERQVVPLGSTKPVALDVRFCAATHRDLELLAQNNRFRKDLLGRLCGFLVRLPPLRERREDLGVIIAVLLQRIVPERAERVSFRKSTAQALLSYSWPMNIRELEKCLEMAVILAKGDRVELEHLPDSVRNPRRQIFSKGGNGIEREDLEKLVIEHKGNLAAIARALGKDRVQVRRWLRQHKIDLEKFRAASK
jgi:transcriptional regulator of acetoin/glycerol metabolism